jgi:predicted HTH transcriptional regulator
VTFAEDIASFANADGGVLIVGVNNSRDVVGIGSGGELESRLKFARDILAERLDYLREIVSFNQVMVPDIAGAKRHVSSSPSQRRWRLLA